MIYGLKDIKLCDWNKSKRRVLKTLQQAYSREKQYDFIMPRIENILKMDFKYAVDLNEALLYEIFDILNISTRIVKESDLDIDFVEKNIDIINICNALNGDTYVSGSGGKDYIDSKLFYAHDLKIVYLDNDYDKLSVVDYLFKNGREKLWKQ